MKTQSAAPIRNNERIKYAAGVLWFITHMVVSLFNDTIVKLLGIRLPVVEITFFRFLFGVLSLLPFILYYGKDSLKTTRPGVHLSRGILLFFAMNLWAWGVGIVPIAVVTVMALTVPMFVLILAPIFLREKVGVELWAVTIIGALGVYITLNPQHTAFNPYSVVLLLAALMFATLDIINKKFIVRETMIGMLFYSTLVTLVLSIYPMYNSWVRPHWDELLLLALLGAGGNLILYCILKAFQAVAASSLSPYRYLELVLSAVVGYVLFSEVPTLSTIIGCCIIVPANFYIAYANMRKPTTQKAHNNESEVRA